MLNRSFTLLLLITVLLSFQCRKHHKTEIEKLPPVTQSGANTFGCLINGKAWTPAGFDQNPNFFVMVDPSFAQGDLSIRTYRIANGIREDFTISSDSIRAVGMYPISDTSRTKPRFQKSSSDLSKQFCEIPYSGIYNRQGYLKITEYDLQSGIVSGEFEVSMVNKDCGYGDTIKITNGRFDITYKP